MTAPKSDRPDDARWLAENREAILSINAFLETYGLLANRLRYRPQGPTADDQPSDSI
jgi:post-segregation antitoxin (ccd killing protein)